MQRRVFVRLIGGGVVTAAAAPALTACSSDLPAEALAAWQGPGNPPPPGTDPRRWLLAHAILAPHSHNLQSWLVDLREPGVITLSVDRGRLLPETDPFSRQMMMSQGTFLELLDQAARAIGLRAEITLFPDGVPPPDRLTDQPTARIRLLAQAGVTPDPLFAQIFRRRTNREAYESREPDAQALRTIAESVTGHESGRGLRLDWTGAARGEALRQHREIAMAAWKIEMETPRTILESYRWLRIGPKEIAQHRDGISINSPLVRALTAVGLFDRSVAPKPGDSAVAGQIRTFNERIAGTPLFFTLVSADNLRPTQVAAGRAYVRAQLAATALGISMHPLQQALQEYPEQAAGYRQIHQLAGATAPGETVQMWARVGFAPPVSPAPRRGVEAHLAAR
jgi:hypothetical protein